MAMVGAVADGYATVTTDAGLNADGGPDTWALVSSGNVNLYALQNFGSAIIANALIARFYGRPSAYSYWNGCSQGGKRD
ncbi:hypothetical protein B0T26DRAFT_754175 [Lasiosphaeria miniovina]|uniref:Carboxylic ester hydrolase n=1 Tax=Lasiosphaeria miniovina TaxID=1954250 RepID=A0AA40AE17_9PEZI|nr:uncharacterized protein B0T26DRAFT_754175 [Lasiosphaeria miniovina]KAK0714146.1 hypothetical protein B0T26DRAFT_754175 [Lasiosphaeria miniovina]